MPRDRNICFRPGLAGMAVAMAVLTTLWAVQQFDMMPKRVDTMWFALIGSVLTVVVGSVSARLRGAPVVVGVGSAATGSRLDERVAAGKDTSSIQ